MTFGTDKCKLMYVGKNNPSYIYTMIGPGLTIATRGEGRDKNAGVITVP